MKILHDNKIIYRRYPTTDIPTETYDWGWYYEDGTHQCYVLFNTDFMIGSFNSYVWHLCVIRYLNQDMDKYMFTLIAKHISTMSNGFINFKIKNKSIDLLVENLSTNDHTIPPRNKIRKVIFKPLCGLTKEQKQKIVGRMVGRKGRISPDNIYNCMLTINNNNEVITDDKIASLLSCSRRTIIRNMGDELRKEKEILNKSLMRHRLK